MNIKMFNQRLCTVTKSDIILKVLFFGFFFLTSFSLSPFSVFVFVFFVSLSQALVNTNSFCQGICGCVRLETETWEHWACLLLIEYAWLGLPGAVSDEGNENVNVFGAVVGSQRPLKLNLCTYTQPERKHAFFLEVEYLRFNPYLIVFTAKLTQVIVASSTETL